jgi:Tol biopolymer transport system component/DNA-binding winged helix-turn-helix (wHTH) protein
MTYRFEGVEIDAEAFRVTRGGESIRLEPKALELLLFLVANPGRLVTKAEIQDAVWKDTFVTDNALTRLVAQIRKALGDDAREARYIETVPTRGYRFVAPLETAASAPAGEPSARAEPYRSPGLRAAAIVTALFVLTFVGLGLRNRSERLGVALGHSARKAFGAVERQISTSAALNQFPCFSPDGASLAFATLRGDAMEIVVRALAPGATEVAVTNDGMQNVEPAFSPDGRMIAYHSVERGGLWLVPASGGVPRPLTTFGSRPAWSPDGTRIAFQSQSWVGSAEGLSAAGEGSTLWLVGAAGGEPRPLTSIPEVGPGGQGAPAWSPDGRLISFLAGVRVMTVRAEGGGLRQSSADLWATGVAWERHGRSQIWTGSQAGNWFAWRVPVAPRTGEPSGPPQVLATGGENASAWAHPALSPDGRTIAYVTFRTRYGILAQGLTPDGRPAGMPVPVVPGVAGRKVPLGFSPDGRRLAFGTFRPGVGPSFWVADMDSGAAKLVVERPGLQWARGWFPDGRLGFMANGASGRRLWSVDVDTREERDLREIEGHLSLAPLVSPDGRSLVSHGARNGALNVWVMDTPGGPARPLTGDPEGVGWPAWSPDGKTLAVEVMRGGNTRIGLMPSTGGAVRELVSTPGQNWPRSFSPDGGRVAFAGQRRGIWNVYWAPIDGGAEQQVTGHDSPAIYVRYPDWSPAGDRIAYEHAESTSTVWTTELPAAAPPR